MHQRMPFLYVSGRIHIEIEYFNKDIIWECFNGQIWWACTAMLRNRPEDAPSTLTLTLFARHLWRSTSPVFKNLEVRTDEVCRDEQLAGD
jgi:hypothetical protein